MQNSLRLSAICPNASVLLLLVLLVSAGCEDRTFASRMRGHSLSAVVDELGQPHTTCAVRVDTAAIVSGKNLDEFVTLLQAGPFQTFRNKNQIPRSVSEQLKCLTTDNFSLANPGEAYDCCCTTSGELPRRQLMFLARNQNAVVLVYHIGQGRVAPTYVTIFRLKMGSVVDVWTGYGDWKATSIPDVIAHIQNQRTKGFMLLKDRIDF